MGFLLVTTLPLIIFTYVLLHLQYIAFQHMNTCFGSSLHSLNY